MLGPMRLSRRARYALCGIFDLAWNGGGGTVRVKPAAARQGVPYRFLEQIFQDLRRAGLIAGKRGPGGGYLLTRSPEDISLRRVVEAVEGPLAEEEGADTEHWAPSEHRPDFAWPLLAGRMAAALEALTLADLCREASRRSLDREMPEVLDFQI